MIPGRTDISQPDDQRPNVRLSDSTVRLHISGEEIALEVASAANAHSPIRLPVGSFPQLLEVLKHEPATAMEIETAIADVEEMLMRVIATLPKPGKLVTSSSVFCALAEVLGHATGSPVELEIAQVEEVFNRLASVAFGTPASHVGVPENRSFAAAVIVLRELMHHAGFVSVTLSGATRKSAARGNPT